MSGRLFLLYVALGIILGLIDGITVITLKSGKIALRIMLDVILGFCAVFLHALICGAYLNGQFYFYAAAAEAVFFLAGSKIVRVAAKKRRAPLDK